MEKAPRYAEDFQPGSTIWSYTHESSGLRALVLRGPFSFCAYVGVQTNHVLTAMEDLDFRCHWGISYQGWGTPHFLPEGWYWWGWDYAHYGDASVFSKEELGELHGLINALLGRGKRWSIEEVQEDALNVVQELWTFLSQSEEVFRGLLKAQAP